MFQILVNIIIPVAAGIVFFCLAWYIKQIAPMRTLVTGGLTYRWAFWGFIFFGIYFGSRPLQIMLGPHPMPLIVNNIREFFLIGLFAPAVFVAMMSLVFGSEKILNIFVKGFFALCICLATIFVIVNIFAIGGSMEIFSLGEWKMYDGLWFGNPNEKVRSLMGLLFVIRLIDPVMIIIIAACIVLWRSLTYPAEKMRIYDNMPKKLFFMFLANICFSLSMLSVGFLYIFGKVPNQWWIYYVGGLLSGMFEFISLRLPVKSKVNL
ncbi:MAG: hypothetical protein ABII27_02820 [bacterium]